MKTIQLKGVTVKKLKGIANHLRLIAAQLERGVTRSQANGINDELDQLTYVIDAELNSKKGVTK